MDPSLILILLRSLSKKCPQCGKGKIFYSYLKLFDNAITVQKNFLDLELMILDLG